MKVFILGVDHRFARTPWTKPGMLDEARNGATESVKADSC